VRPVSFDGQLNLMRAASLSTGARALNTKVSWDRFRGLRGTGLSFGRPSPRCSYQLRKLSVARP
jgi:hypothetical protein